MDFEDDDEDDDDIDEEDELDDTEENEILIDDDDDDDEDENVEKCEKINNTVEIESIKRISNENIEIKTKEVAEESESAKNEENGIDAKIEESAIKEEIVSTTTVEIAKPDKIENSSSEVEVNVIRKSEETEVEQKNVEITDKNVLIEGKEEKELTDKNTTSHNDNNTNSEQYLEEVMNSLNVEAQPHK